MRHIVKAAGISFVILSSSLFVTAAQAAQKVGFINTAQVFQSLPQREAVAQKLQAEFKDRKNELDSLKKQLETKTEKARKDGSLMSSKEKEDLKISIGQLNYSLKVKSQAFNQDYQKREYEERNKLVRVISQAAEKVAKKDGYDLIVDTQAVLWGNDASNVTEQVIKELK